MAGGGDMAKSTYDSDNDGKIDISSNTNLTASAGIALTGDALSAYHLDTTTTAIDYSKWVTFVGNHSTGGIGGGVTSIATTSPITGGTITATGTIGINNSAADGTTKGAASFTANDFNATSGNISLDYTNAQKATTSTIGFLTDTDWDKFNEKAPGIVVQNLGTNPSTMDVNSGIKAYATVSSSVTITLSNLIDGYCGTIVITQSGGSGAAALAHSGLTAKKMGMKSNVNSVNSSITKIVYERIGSNLFYGYIYEN
jgi:hypothetical protein